MIAPYGRMLTFFYGGIKWLTASSDLTFDQILVTFEVTVIMALGIRPPHGLQSMYRSKARSTDTTYVLQF
jgi:hypothetical protein